MIVIYLILFTVALLFYILYEGAFSFYLFCFVASYPFIFGVIMLLIRRNLKIGFETVEQSSPKGSSVPVNIIIDNDSRLPVPNCDITVKYKAELGQQTESFKIHTPIFPNNTQVLTLRLSYKHYGSLKVEISKVRIFDMLKIIRLRIKPKTGLNATRIVVFPDHIPIENKINNYSELGLESESFSKNKKGDDPSEIFDIHAYNEGDKISRIHWKLSAKEDDMMVKDYSLPITNGVLIALDFSGLSFSFKDLDIIDTMIDTAAALSLHLAENEMTHSILWCTGTNEGYQKITVNDFESYILAIRLLVNDSLKKASTAPADVLSDLYNGSTACAHVLYITNGLSDSTKNKLMESGYSYKYTVLDPSASNDSGYTDGSFVYAPLAVNAIAESIENIDI